MIGFAVVQPVLGPFGESPETFVAVGASSADIVRFAVVVAVVPLLALVAVAAATRLLGPRVRGVVQTALVAALAGAAVTALVRHLDAGTWARVAAGVAAVAAAALAHRRWEPARTFLRFASPTPLLLVAAFLLASPVAPLVRPPGAGVDGDGDANALPPVLVVVLDELPTTSLLDGRGEVDRQLFPNIARLADTSTWYRNHTSVGSRTAVAMPAIATGRLPDGPERAAVHAEYPDNLFSLLAPTHDVHAVEWATELCPRSLCSAETPPLDDDATALLASPVATADRPLARLVDDAGALWWGQVWPPATPPSAEYAITGATDADELARPGLEFISGMVEGSGGRPTFDYLHSPLPHQPWRLLPSGAHYDGPHPAVGAEFAGWGDHDLGEQLGQAARSRQLLQLQWTDRMLGEIFDRMEAFGRWDDAVVVLTADHGVTFRPGQPVRTLTPENQTDISWTPLFVKAPGQDAPAVVDDNVLSIDVLPTVADLVGVDVGWEVDGIALTSETRTDPTKPTEANQPERFDQQRDDGLVDLDPDGLATVLRAGAAPSGPDELRAWRYGRHGDLLGRPVDELGRCGPGPGVDYEPPPTWSDYVAGTYDRSDGPLPIWHTGTLDVEEPVDVAAAVDGVVVAWAPARGVRGEVVFGLLLAEPLVEGASADPELFQVVDGDGCTLAPLDT